MIRSNPHSLFLLHVKARGLPQPLCEFRFEAERRWKLDCYWPDKKIAVEIHGGTYSGGRHIRGDGFKNDREKMNHAQEMGIRTFEYTTKQVESGYAVEQMGRVLK